MHGSENGETSSPDPAPDPVPLEKNIFDDEFDSTQRNQVPVSQKSQTFADEFSATTPNPSKNETPMFEVEDLIGRTFLMKENQKGGIHRAWIAELIKQHGEKIQHGKEHIKFRCSINNDQYEEILTYNELLDHLNKDEEEAHGHYFYVSNFLDPYSIVSPNQHRDIYMVACLCFVLEAISVWNASARSKAEEVLEYLKIRYCETTKPIKLVDYFATRDCCGI